YGQGDALCERRQHDENQRGGDSGVETRSAQVEPERDREDGREDETGRDRRAPRPSPANGSAHADHSATRAGSPVTRPGELEAGTAGARLLPSRLLDDRVAVRPAGEDPVLRAVGRLIELRRLAEAVGRVGVVDAVVEGAARVRREP